MQAKVVISLASILLVVGVAIGVVTMVRQNNEKSSVSPQMKAVQAVCQPASDQSACVKALAASKSDDPKELVKSLGKATHDAMIKACNFTQETLLKVTKDERGTRKAALQYCKRVFNYSLEDLQSWLDSFSEDVTSITKEQYYDLKQWLLNTWVYQFDCISNALEDDLQKTMEDGIREARTLTLNAMDVVRNLGSIFSNLKIRFNTTSIVNETSAAVQGGRDNDEQNARESRRRLLEDMKDGFPGWVSTADRKLLAKAGRGSNGGGGDGRTLVVAQDGSGQFKTVSKAVEACPPKSNERCIIYIKAGVYREQVIIPKDKKVLMYGDGARKTIITYNRSVGGTPNTVTSLTGTVQVESPEFMAKYIGFRNTAGPAGHQAAALRINGDRAVVFNCRMDGYQDTLYVDSGHQFYRNCLISGTVDFIFGASNTVIQNSQIIVRRGAKGQFNTVTADGTETLSQGTGIVLQNCRIVPDKRLNHAKLEVQSYLGRPWKEASTAVVMQTEIGDLIHPEGWHIWDGKSYHKSCYFREYENRGPGSRTDMRVKWSKVITNRAEAERFSADRFVFGRGNYILGSGIPFRGGL